MEQAPSAAARADTIGNEGPSVEIGTSAISSRVRSGSHGLVSAAPSGGRRGLRPRAPGLFGGLRLETSDSLSRVSGRGLGRGTAKALSEWAAARGGRAARSVDRAPRIVRLRERGGHGGRSSLPHRARTTARTRALVDPHVPAASGGGPWLVGFARRLRHLHSRIGFAASASGRGLCPRAPASSNLLRGRSIETRASLSRASGRGLGRGTAKVVSERGRCDRRARR